MKKPQTFRIGKLERFIAECEIRLKNLREFLPNDPEGVARAKELEEIISNLKDEFNLSNDSERCSE